MSEPHSPVGYSRHQICDFCWHRLNGDRVPVRVRESEKMVCCYCGESTASGIYVRDLPQPHCPGSEAP